MAPLDLFSQKVKSGNHRALSRAITIVEQGGESASRLLQSLFPYTGSAYLIGVTGAPGVGKSTLVDALLTEIRKQGTKVGVLAIDPTSPFTGGALLGDRIRMQTHTLDNGVFIRSMANRGTRGGLTIAVWDAVRMLEAAGFEVIIIETVGAGQSELDIVNTADTTVLVVMPGSGDDVQALKSGIMEIGDLFIVNKSDLPGAQKTSAEISKMLELSSSKNGWNPPVCMTTANTTSGVSDVWRQIRAHKEYLGTSDTYREKQRKRALAEMEELVAEIARHSLKSALKKHKLEPLVDQVLDRKLDPHTAALSLVKQTLGT